MITNMHMKIVVKLYEHIHYGTKKTIHGFHRYLTHYCYFIK